MGDIEVSVVIVNWNTRGLLLDVVASLKAATHRTRMEIIVVDNASHDDSVAAISAAHPDVQVIRNAANLGFARANNIGFAAARGESFCLVNTDVVAGDGVIDELWDFLQNHPEVAAVGPRTLHEDGRTRQNCRRFPTLANAAADHLWLRRLGLRGRALPLHTYDHTHDAEVLSGCFLMVSRNAFDKVGGLDEDFFFYGEDTDWGKRFHEAGWRAVYHPGATATHFGGASTAAHPVRYYLIMEKADLMYWRKHHPGWRTGIYKGIRVLHNLACIAGWSMAWVLRPGSRAKAGLKVRGNAINTVWLLTGRSLVATPGWDHY